MQFIAPENWNEGEHDESKLAEEEIMGATRKGVWVQVGEKGVYDFEQCQDSSAKEEVIHDSVADGPFCETALQRKRAAVTQAVKTGSQSREKAAAQGAQLSMSSLLATVHQHAGSGGSKVSKHGAAGPASSSDSTSSDSGEESGGESDEPAFSGTVAALFAEGRFSSINRLLGQGRLCG